MHLGHFPSPIPILAPEVLYHALQSFWIPSNLLRKAAQKSLQTSPDTPITVDIVGLLDGELGEGGAEGE